jgi:cobalamin 5'-phosphate synthase/cobalamin synthase
MKSLLASIAFCTRIPIRTEFSAEDIGRAAMWFPVVGALLGLVSLALARGLNPFLPPLVIAILILAVEALITGALHHDGFADAADGLGGGKSREDCLRIMRDHAIGSYGATALILLLGLKAAAISALITANHFSVYLILASVLGRWNVVLLSRWLPYARPSEAVSRHIGTAEFVWATVLCAAIVLPIARWHGAICWGAAAMSAALYGWLCLRKIGGVTGDTLGASEQIGEALVLVLGAALR